MKHQLERNDMEGIVTGAELKKHKVPSPNIPSKPGEMLAESNENNHNFNNSQVIKNKKKGNKFSQMFSTSELLQINNGKSVPVFFWLLIGQ